MFPGPHKSILKSWVSKRICECEAKEKSPKARMSCPQSPSNRPAVVTIAPPPPKTPNQPIKMSVTTPPPAPKKRPAFVEPFPKKTQQQKDEEAADRMLLRAFGPPGKFVPLVFTPQQEERIFEAAFQNLPAWFHFDSQNQPRSLAEKKNLLATLEKV